VVNTKTPIPVCMNGLSITLDDDGLAELWDVDINGGSYHPCQNSFTTGFNAATDTKVIYFDCADLGMQQVSLYVRDSKTGQSDFCIGTVDIQDPLGSCNSQRLAVAGEIYTEELNYVEEVKVELATTMPFEMTDDQGQYAFRDMPMGGDYSLKPQKDIDYLNGVSTLDLILIQRHILGLQALNSPYKLIAADVNSNKEVNGIDLIELRKLILGIYTDLPANESWRFVDAAYEFIDPLNPWKQQIDETYVIKELSGDMDIDFIGVKIGDVNGTAITSAADTGISARSSSWPVVLEFDQAKLAEEEVAVIPVYGRNYEEVSGWQATLEFAPTVVEILDIQGKALDIQAGYFNYGSQDEGWLTMSYHNLTVETVDESEVLFEIVVRTKQRLSVAELFELSSSVTRAEAYRGYTQVVDMRTESKEVKQVSINSVTPNPWISHTDIEFMMPEDGEANWEFYDVNGRIIHKLTKDYKQGRQVLQLDRVDMTTPGIIYIKLTTDFGIAESKMIMIK